MQTSQGSAPSSRICRTSSASPAIFCRCRVSSSLAGFSLSLSMSRSFFLNALIFFSESGFSSTAAPMPACFCSAGPNDPSIEGESAEPSGAWATVALGCESAAVSFSCSAASAAACAVSLAFFFLVLREFVEAEAGFKSSGDMPGGSRCIGALGARTFVAVVDDSAAPEPSSLRSISARPPEPRAPGGRYALGAAAVPALGSAVRSRPGVGGRSSKAPRGRGRQHASRSSSKPKVWSTRPQ
mmetsp:Transcript_101537/g.327691  ORF Transcript_101537/g.327691 Transcript_101537/m.327691 type:complete len:241 (-) Transcript_101537:1225-1947(-)